MNHSDRISLLRDGVSPQGRTWVEFGSGSGAFTLALAELINPNGIIYSVNKDPKALQQQEQTMREGFPNLNVRYLIADFSRPLDLPLLDGILIANALHYIKEKESFISKIRDCFKPGGQLLIVEYNVEKGNPWVPYPISFKSWEALAKRCGFAATRLLKTMASRYHKEIYSAVSYL